MREEVGQERSQEIPIGLSSAKDPSRPHNSAILQRGHCDVTAQIGRATSGDEGVPLSALCWGFGFPPLLLAVGRLGDQVEHELLLNYELLLWWSVYWIIPPRDGLSNVTIRMLHWIDLRWELCSIAGVAVEKVDVKLDIEKSGRAGAILLGTMSWISGRGKCFVTKLSRPTTNTEFLWMPLSIGWLFQDICMDWRINYRFSICGSGCSLRCCSVHLLCCRVLLAAGCWLVEHTNFLSTTTDDILIFGGNIVCSGGSVNGVGQREYRFCNEILLCPQKPSHSVFKLYVSFCGQWIIPNAFSHPECPL